MSAASALEALARDADRFADDWPRDAATIVERTVTAGLRAATGDGGLSHGPGMGRATVTVHAGAGQARVEAGGSQAVWTIIETGTRPHVTLARAGSVLRTPFGPRPLVRVRGTAGRHTWSRAVDRAMPVVKADARAEFHRLVQ